MWFSVKDFLTLQIKIPVNTAWTNKSTLYVRLLDTGLADAPSRVLAEKTITDLLSKFKDNKVISLFLKMPPGIKEDDCTISIHIAINGNSQITPGDLINGQSYPLNILYKSRDLFIEMIRVN